MKITFSSSAGPKFETLFSRVAHHARQQPEAAAIECCGIVTTWKDLSNRAERIACNLIHAGIQPGRRVAVLAANSGDYVAVLLGIIKAGCSVVPLSGLMSAEAIAGMLDDCEPVAVFVDRGHRHIAPEPDREGSDGASWLSVGFDFGGDGWLSLQQWLAAHDTLCAMPDVDEENEFNIIYSSGTTSIPKGIVHTHGLRSLQAASLGFDQDTVTLLATPLCSNWSLFGLINTLWGGGKTILMDKFSESGFVDACLRYGVTDTLLVPAQLVRLCLSTFFKELCEHSNITKFCAGAPLHRKYKADIVDRWPGSLIEVYGLTEGGVATVLEANRFPGKLGSVGKPVDGTELKIIDESGQDLPTGSVGEIVGRSSVMMKGYNNLPEKTREIIYTDGEGGEYFRSGDMGYVDEDGFLYLADRKKDMIVSGGLNVYASDIEAVLAEHPGVCEVAVIGVPSERWGETPLALVIPKNWLAINTEELRGWANERLGKHQKISALEWREVFPRGNMDKVLKRELRKPYWEQEND